MLTEIYLFSFLADVSLLGGTEEVWDLIGIFGRTADAEQASSPSSSEVEAE